MNRQRGFGMIAAIMVLVILAALAAAIVGIGTNQQITSAQDVMSAKAWQAARTGNEWGLYKALKTENWAGAGTTCDAGAQSATLDLSALTGFFVTISCNSWLYNEGESVPGTPQTVRIYGIRAVACPLANCTGTNDASSGTYVERTRAVIATN